MKHSLVTLLVVFNSVFTLVVNAQIEKWSTHFNNTLIFSSPRFTDINQDGTQDIIIGGGNEFSPTENGILAINGKNGAVLWKCAAPTQIYTSALFQDLNKDGVDDVFIGGRTGQFYALDGKTGTTLAKDQLPEHREIYYAPHLHYNYGQDSATILFGTGGEAIDGKLWEVSLSELIHNDISKARVLLSDSVKGFIVSSVLSDVNNDGLLDIINARINSGVSLVDGKTKTTVWEQFFPSFESYTSPTVGQFTGDETMDVFVLNAHGTFPNYDFFNGSIIDGKSGEIVYNDYAGLMQFASALSADVNADGFDEIIYVQNHFDPISESASCQVMVFDFHNLNTYCVGPVFEGTVFSSTPSLIDINNDDIFEFVFAHSNSFMSNNVFSEVTLLELEWKNLKPTYPCFLGQEGNGVIQK
jgi:outer membrane protein assembly factor BamB